MKTVTTNTTFTSSFRILLECVAAKFLQLLPAKKQNVAYQFTRRPYVFKTSPISPDNNLEMILGAFIQAPQHQIVICGEWDKTEYGRNLRQDYAIFPNIHLIDQVYNSKELNNLIKNAFAYIHGNHPEGVNGKMVDAMYMGLPVIALETTENKEATNSQALYFASAEELAYIINTTTIGRFRNIGKAMQQHAESRYTWQPEVLNFQHLFSKRNPTRQQSKGLQFDMGY